MQRLVPIIGIALVIVGGPTTGCQQPDEKAPLLRPAELDHLEMFVGNWFYRISEQEPGDDEVSILTGTDSYQWASDRHVLLNNWQGNEGGEQYEGLMVWSWNAAAKRYEIASYYSSGAVGTGTATYDATTRIWRIEGTVEERATGETTISEGTLTFRNAETIAVSGTRWDKTRLHKLGEFTGELRRR